MSRQALWAHAHTHAHTHVPPNPHTCTALDPDLGAASAGVAPGWGAGLESVGEGL